MKVRPSMKLARIVLGSVVLPACVTLVGCSDTPGGDLPARAGTTGAGAGTGGRPAGSGGSGNPSGGSGNTTSFAGSGNSPNGGSGNTTSFAGSGNNPNGGSGNTTSFAGSGSGGRANGGAGGRANGGSGGRPNGGAGGSGAGTAGAAGAPALNCATPMPTGGTTVTSDNKSGKAAGLDWTIWSNKPSKPGSITTYDTPAFTGTWNDSGDFLARIGLQWNGTKTHQQLGTIAAQFSVKKNGTAGDYSFIGIYGWSLSPCVEWYIVDQSYKPMPFNPGNTTKMGPDTMIDDGLYIFYKRTTNGTGGSKCGSQATWDQYYSIRKTGRDCGHISISEHFKAWEANGLPLGKIDQAQILLEVGGGMGSADFNVANVTLTPP